MTDGTTAYAWTTHFGPVPVFVSVPVAGGPLVDLGPYGLLFPILELDAGLITPATVYWADGQQVRALARSTAAVTTLATGPVRALAQDSDCVYWLDGQKLITLAK